MPISIEVKGVLFQPLLSHRASWLPRKPTRSLHQLFCYQCLVVSCPQEPTERHHSVLPGQLSYLPIQSVFDNWVVPHHWRALSQHDLSLCCVCLEQERVWSWFWADSSQDNGRQWVHFKWLLSASFAIFMIIMLCVMSYWLFNYHLHLLRFPNPIKAVIFWTINFSWLA